jgi:hypothetical protein
MTEQQPESKEMLEEKLRLNIEALEKKKGDLIDRIKQLNRRVRYKKYEKKALEPFLEQTKEIQIYPLRKRKKAMEFRIATQAYTPRMEREWLKEVKKLDEKLKDLQEVERARRKKKYVDQDIEEGEQEIVTIEKELKTIREQLKKLYDEHKTVRVAARRTAAAAARQEEEMVALGDIALFEDEEEKNS